MAPSTVKCQSVIPKSDIDIDIDIDTDIDCFYFGVQGLRPTLHIAFNIKTVLITPILVRSTTRLQF